VKDESNIVALEGGHTHKAMIDIKKKLSKMEDDYRLSRKNNNYTMPIR